MELDVVEVNVPISKSIANRLQIINALQGHYQKFTEKTCDDVELMRNALHQGAGTINIGHCGTAMRFLTAYFAQMEGCDVVLDGSVRMRKRPIGTLVHKLHELGAEIEYLGEKGCPPLKIRGKRLSGGVLTFQEAVSSQYISALMMIAPYMNAPLTINLPKEMGSRPYMELTVALMRESGGEVVCDNEKITVNNTPYSFKICEQEGDWSAASYWYGMCALSKQFVSIKGLRYPSIQGDSKIVDIFQELGVVTEQKGENLLLIPTHPKKSISVNLSDTLDIAQILMVTCCYLGVHFAFSGLSFLKYKECDRLYATQRELAKLGYDVAIGSDWAVWSGKILPPTSRVIETYNDHRMAMSFALAAIHDNIEIEDKEVVSKSFPAFWDNLEQFGLRID